MRFGVFYEHQLSKPWNPSDEERLFHQALDQVVPADRLGFDYAWEVEHHFLDEYSHSSAPEGRHLDGFEAAGVDRVIFMQQAGRNRHDHICEALELFAAELMPRYADRVAGREARKAEELAPFVAAAMARKRWMKPLTDDEIPVVRASVAKPQVNQ
jgi:hypothetical protein